ncbi:peptidoglycan-binding protein [Streptomyces sp. NPDC085614]|uniref:peptidoglycan-binding domain-containing protein n=1 Tax=unclassified Streptomyces TaxID=2593676 RepID=UPI001650309D|nr:peptidoglycan-binding domain-containing protein [Streptomyces sp. ms191]
MTNRHTRMRGPRPGRRAATALTAAVLLLGAGVTTASAAPRTDTSTLSAQAGCTIRWRTTDNYAGFTAGYSWAWNVEVGPGATGDRVREIQCLINNHAYYDGPRLTVDGDYGNATKTAVRTLQRNWGGIGVDGIVGPDTWRALRHA